MLCQTLDFVPKLVLVDCDQHSSLPQRKIKTRVDIKAAVYLSHALFSLEVMFYVSTNFNFHPPFLHKLLNSITPPTIKTLHA
jgi:hypothetical protein